MLRKVGFVRGVGSGVSELSSCHRLDTPFAVGKVLRDGAVKSLPYLGYLSPYSESHCPVFEIFLRLTPSRAREGIVKWGKPASLI